MSANSIYCPCSGKIIVAFWLDEDGLHGKMQCDSDTILCARVVEATKQGPLTEEAKARGLEVMKAEWVSRYGPFNVGN